jgi:hypothetical protein
MMHARIIIALFGARRMIGLALAAGLMAAAPSQAARLCVGDCNDDGRVSVNELVLGVNIASDLLPIEECPIFDANFNDVLTIDEIIQGVNNGLDGCPESVCGDGFVDLDGGETCDDGNTDEGCGDTCPSNCRIELCTPTAARVTVDVNFSTDVPELLLVGLTPFVRYPDGVVEIPGRADDASVLARVTSQTFSITPNDQNYGLCSVLLDPTFAGVEPGTAITVEFDLCEGASMPTADQFSCGVEDAADVNLTPVTGDVSCSIVVR